jgi:hypothetical protein
MVKQLAALKLQSPFSADDNFVFASKTGEAPVCPRQRTDEQVRAAMQEAMRA